MKRLKKMGGFGKLAAMFGEGGRMERALGGMRPGRFAGGCPGFPVAAAGFNLPPGFDKFSKK